MIRITKSACVFVLVLSAASISIGLYYLLRSDSPNQIVLQDQPILHVTSRSEWEAALRTKYCIVFIDGYWNIDVARFQKPFQRFASWFQSRQDSRAIIMSINPENTSDDVWRICQEIWSQNKISEGGLKHYGGAGRILWIEDGKILDFDWCMTFMKDNLTDNTEALLKDRTVKVFGQ